jgi:hypothetical protein
VGKKVAPLDELRGYLVVRAAGTIRTYDLLYVKKLLYPLSYSGTHRGT